MRGSIAVFILAVAGLGAQYPYGKVHAFAAPSPKMLDWRQPSANPCAVRLLEPEIPEDMTFTMKVVPAGPPADRMPEVQVPAPPCPKGR